MSHISIEVTGMEMQQVPYVLGKYIFYSNMVS